MGEALTERQRARRARILSAARQLVAEHGYEGTIMRDVAMQAEVSPTTLYNLYNTKDELMLAALREQLAEGWSLVAADAPGCGLQRLLIQAEVSVGQTVNAPAYARAITQALFRAHPGDQIVEALLTDLTRVVGKLLGTMQAHGDLKAAADLDRLAQRTVACFWTNYYLWAMEITHIDDLEMELKQGFIDVLQASLAPGAAEGCAELLNADALSGNNSTVETKEARHV